MAHHHAAYHHYNTENVLLTCLLHASDRALELRRLGQDDSAVLLDTERVLVSLWRVLEREGVHVCRDLRVSAKPRPYLPTRLVNVLLLGMVGKDARRHRHCRRSTSLLLLRALSAISGVWASMTHPTGFRSRPIPSSLPSKR